MAAGFEFDVCFFRESYPAFSNAAAFPDALLRRHYHAACQHIDPRDNPKRRLKGDGLVLALGLMTAHLVELERCILSGNMPQQVASATVDKVSVTLVPPPTKNGREHWYSLTTYGQQLLVLRKGKAAGGIFAGGSPAERGAFRKAGGVFRKW